MALVKSISGIRGTIGGRVAEGLSPVDVVRFTAAYATQRKAMIPDNKTIVVGRDARLSGEMVDQLVCGTLIGMGYDVINSMYFTSCGDAKSSALISALRGVVLLLAFTLILPAFLGMTGVWLAAPCTEALTAIVSLLLITKQKKNVSMMVLNS